MIRPNREIVSKSGVVHFRRWVILGTPWFSIYLHQILQPDQDPHLHNHPWSLRSLVLRGRYIEKFRTNDGDVLNERKPGNYAHRTLADFHKIEEVVDGPVWTLNLVGARENDNWGYLMDDCVMPHVSYRSMKRKGELE